MPQPLSFTAEAGEAFCDAMWQTNTLDEALEETKICSSPKTLYAWLRMSERGREEFIFEWLGVKGQFHEHWEYAQTLQAQRLAEEVETKARDLMDELREMDDQKKGSNRVQVHRAFQDMVKWKAGYLDRKRFGKQNDAAGPLLGIQVVLNFGDKPLKVSLTQKDAIENNNRSNDQRLIVAVEED